MPGSTTASTKSPKNCYVSLIPMSERQQMKLVRQLETCDGRGGIQISWCSFFYQQFIFPN